MVHLRVRNRFAKNPDSEHDREGNPDQEELEAALAGDLQHVLAALRRSAYAPPLRLVPVDTFRHHGGTQAQSGEIESAEAGLADAVSNSVTELRARRARKRGSGKRIAAYGLTAIAALFGCALVFQQALGLAGSFAEAETMARRAATRIVETAPVGLVIVLEVAADPLRGRAQDQRQMPSKTADVSAAGTDAPTTAPSTNPVSLPPPKDPSGLPRSVDLRPTSNPTTKASDEEAPQSSVPSPDELQASSSWSVPVTEAILNLRPSMKADDGPSLLSAETAQELVAIGQVAGAAAPLALTEAEPGRPAAAPDEGAAQQTSVKRGTAVSLSQPITSTVKTSVNMRAGPDNAAAVVAVIPEGGRVTVTSCKFWCEVVFDGQRGWVYNEFVNLVGSPVGSDLAGAPKTVETRRRCEQQRSGWGAAVARTIRKGFVADGDGTAGSARNGERC